MNTIIIKTQTELDALPDLFGEFTVIEIRSEVQISIRKTYKNASVTAYDSASVTACDSASVTAYNSASVTAFGNASVNAYDSASVTAYGSASVCAFGSASVTACDSASVTAYNSASVNACDSARVTAYDSARVTAYGSASVCAFDSARVNAYGSARVTAFGNASVNAYVSASVTAYNSASVNAYVSASVTAYESSVIFCNSKNVKIEALLDSSTLKLLYRETKKSEIEIKKIDSTAQVIELHAPISFETWLGRGVVSADGIKRKLLSQKKLGEIEVYECEEFGENKSSYLVKKGNLFSHGETVEKAIEDLRYKIDESRDLSEFKKWAKDQLISTDDLIKAYRMITGACEFGVKDFCSNKTLSNMMTIAEAVVLTKGAYGNEKFEEFFK